MSDNNTNSRSTLDIVWGCVATVFACTWVSVHPNVLGHQSSEIQRLRHRVSLMLWGLIAPEFLVVYAYRQWVGSKNITKDVQRIMNDEDSGHEMQSRVHKWTQTHSHFLQMGGFMFRDSSRANDPPVFVEVEQMTERAAVNIGRQAIHHILRSLPTEDEIWDKSKGDIFVKLLTVLQTSWFVAQTLSRAAQRLVITEMEVITLAYATFNVAMFFFWRSKPLDVQCPIIISFDGATALRTTSDPAFDVETMTGLSFQLDSENTSGSEYDTTPPLTPLSSTLQSTRSRDTSNIEGGIPIHLSTVHSDQHAPQSEPRLQRGRMRIIQSKTLHYIHKPLNIMHKVYVVTGFRKHRGKYPISAFSHAHEGEKSYFSSKSGTGIGLRSKVPMFYAYSSSDYAPKSILISALAMFLASCFGAAHCIAWSSPRLTKCESVLWRAASLMICLSPVISCITFLVAAWFSHLLTAPYRPRLYMAVKWVLLNVLAPFHNHLFIPLLLPLYLVARVVLLALAFAQLRNLPKSALQDVDWSKFMPHI